MIYLLLLALISSVITGMLGYWVHMSFHHSWSGPFFKAHQSHHFIQYPPGDLVSEVYRDAGKDNTLYLFALVFIPVIGAVIASIFLFGVSILSAIVIIVSMIGTGLLNDRLHDSFHLFKSPWQILPFYKNWQRLHFIHHYDISKNYGIYSFTYDKLFKTFSDT